MNSKQFFPHGNSQMFGDNVVLRAQVQPEGGSVVIRRAEFADLEHIYECETTCFEQSWTYVMLYDDIIENPNTVYLVVELDGDIIGYGGMWIVMDEAHITNVCIRPEFRQRGYAKHLMDALSEASRRNGAKAMTLEVRVSNKAALRLYKRCGFSIQGLRKKYYQNSEDAYVMWTEQ